MGIEEGMDLLRGINSAINRAADNGHKQVIVTLPNFHEMISYALKNTGYKVSVQGKELEIKWE